MHIFNPKAAENVFQTTKVQQTHKIWDEENCLVQALHKQNQSNGPFANSTRSRVSNAKKVTQLRVCNL